MKCKLSYIVEKIQEFAIKIHRSNSILLSFAVFFLSKITSNFYLKDRKLKIKVIHGL